MKTRTLLCLAMTTSVLCACQSAPRKYDGVLGYKVDARTEAGVVITYTDAAKKSDKKMQSGLLAACAKELAAPAEKIRLDLKSQKEFVQQVNMSVPIPIAMATSGSSTHGGQMGPAQASMASSKMNEVVYRDMPLKTVSADCQVSG